MNILITICARGGSKGIPGKNIRSLSGKPLINYSIECAKKFAQLYSNTNIALSTDSSEIKDVAEKAGLTTAYQRPSSLATDSSGKIETIKDLLYFEEKQNNTSYDYIIDLDITSPLRTIDDLRQAFDKLLATPDAYNLFSVSPASRNPYFNMVEESSDGFVALVKQGNFHTRQAAPAVFDMNASFYIYRRSFFSSNINTAITSKSIVYVIPHICFDLDEPIDFSILELLINNNLLSFDI